MSAVRSGKTKKPASTRRPPLVVKVKVPKGGFKAHLVPIGELKALCGYAPSGRSSHIMVNRSGWTLKRPLRDCLECCQLASKRRAHIFTVEDQLDHHRVYAETKRLLGKT